jgi:replication factor A1
VRLTKKHPKKFWRNPKGKGTLLNLELIDSFGTQIQSTLFNDLADKYDLSLTQNSVYLCSKGQIKLANLKYTSIKNQYTIVFDKNSEIQEVKDDMQIQMNGFCFRGI